jgi:CBS domain-containing protein
MTTAVHVRTIRAADVMSSPVATIDETSSIWEAGDLMVGRRVHHAVVVRRGHCIGVLTDRDILEAWHRGPAALRSTGIGQLVAVRTACVLSDAPLSHVARVMNTNRVDAVPVIDESGNAIGIVTAGDVVHAVAEYGVSVAQAAGMPRQRAT